MPAPTHPSTCRARSDGRDWLVEAGEPLAGLQLRSGGELPGVIANPALLELVRKARHYGLSLAGPVQAQDGFETVTMWAEARPDAETGGCEITLTNWQTAPVPPEDTARQEERRLAIVRHAAELSLRLGARQDIVAVGDADGELAPLAHRMRGGIGQPWTDFVDLPGNAHEQPLHWRLLDGAEVRLDGSARRWTASLIPLGRPEPGSAGFELHLASDQPPPEEAPPEVATPEEVAKPQRRSAFSTAIGREIAPVLRQPIARIIANAETIRTQLAGPLAEEYSAYAADIATAGEHLLALIDDLADLEVVEDEQFSTAPDRVDLADLARRAAGILGVRAQEKGIAIDAPKPGESAPAVAEFRRVLQVLLNLLGNAIRYSPGESQIWLRVETAGDRARIIVADQGEGMTDAQQARIFEKFERLGRSGDGGSGLGLYISRRLARAMGGDLTVESAPGQGARFTLDLPADLSDNRQS